MTLSALTGPCAEKIRNLLALQDSTEGSDEGARMLPHILGSMLRSAAPKLLLWGPQLATYYNDAYASIAPDLGTEKLGTPYPTFRPQRWELIRDLVEAAFQGEERLQSRFEIEGISQDDGTRHFIAYFTPVLDHTGTSRGVLIDVHDATEDRRLSDRLLLENEHLQALFAETPVFMAYGTGADMRLKFVNEAFRRLYGFRPLEGLTVFEAIPEAEEQGFARLLESVLQSGQPFVGHDMPLRIRDPGGGERLHYVDFVYQPVKDHDGEVAGILCTGMEVTEKFLAQREREQFRHQILHASRVNAMGTMAMTLAHELNQPLAAATNYLSAARRFLIEEASDCGGPLQILEKAMDQIARAGEIIRRMRPIVRSGEANRQSISVACATRRAAELLRASGFPGLAVQADISPDAEYVLADEIQLEQVLANLLRNSAEASADAAEHEVIVSARRTAGDRIRVSVRDFGRGFTPEQLENDFALDAGEQRDGLGVGLSLSRTLIEANGGALSAANAEGGGAIFSFVLEAAQPDTGDQNAERS